MSALTVQITWGELSVTVQRDNDAPDAVDDAIARVETSFLRIAADLDTLGLLDEVEVVDVADDDD